MLVWVSQKSVAVTFFADRATLAYSRTDSSRETDSFDLASDDLWSIRILCTASEWHEN